MSKAEFLSGLRKALEGNISESSIQSNIAYYDSYIAEEVQKGSTEEEVLGMLGDPWVIARTIIEAEDGTDQESVYEANGKNYSNSSRTERRTENIYKVDEWWKKLLLILTIVMIVVVAIAIVTGLIRLFAPILIPILVVLLVIRLFERRR